MKSQAAVLFESPGRYRVVEVDLDEPKDHEVVVKYTARGLCATDVHYVAGTNAGPMPFCAVQPEVRHSPADRPYRAGKLKLDGMITGRYRLDDINTAVDDMLEG
jgi:Zn-dependent alcohol dehydrogenase